MGACQFDTTHLGKTADEAFTAARDQAAHEYGHGGYTGTIAEKGGYRLVDVPAGFTPDSFVRTLTVAAAYDPDARPIRGTVEFRWQRDAAAAYARLTGAVGVPHARRLIALVDDKYGDCLAVEVRGKALTDAKARHDSCRAFSYETDRRGNRIAGTHKFCSPSARGMHLYRFVGTASE